MYDWDIDKLNKCYNNLLNAKGFCNTSFTVDELDEFLELYSFFKGIYKENECDITKEKCLDFLKKEHESMRSSNIIETDVFKALIKQKEIPISLNNKNKCEDYNESDAITTIKKFLSNICPIYLSWFQKLLNNNSICLRKNTDIQGFIKQFGSNDVFLGVSAPDIETLMYVLVHEFGHYVAAENSSLCHGLKTREALPILFEVYLFEYLSSQDYDSSDYFKYRFIKTRNEELLALKLFKETYESNDDSFIEKKLEDYINTNSNFFTFDIAIDYCLSKYMAINSFRENGNIKEFKQRFVNSSEELKRTPTLDIFKEDNEDIVKRLILR